MSDHYRINVRFNMSKKQERTAAEYLGKLSEKSSGTRNRFIVNAIIEAIDRKEDDDSISLDDIRAMFREELKSVSITTSPPPSESGKLDTDLTEEEKEANVENVLAALDMFG